jgi:2-methylfumaryl-CoA hydratase
VSKSDPGRFFEDFRVGQVLRHATPRSVTEADQTLYIALTGSRFALHSSDVFARELGLPRAPLDDLLVFNLVFGRSVADVSLNAVANLGYAACVFGVPVYPGDTLTAESRVLGLRETASGKTGVVWLRTTGTNQRDETVLDYVRWVMVNKRDPAAPAPEPVIPDLPEAAAAARLTLPEGLSLVNYDAGLAGSDQFYDDYQVGERIDHLDGMTLEDAEHQMATRLYQNNARVHFNLHAAQNGRFGKLSFNGLANAFRIAAINGGRHSNPSFAGHTIYAWSEVLEKIDLPGRADVGALRLRSVATKDRPCAEFPLLGPDRKTDPAVVLDLDYTVLMPRG